MTITLCLNYCRIHGYVNSKIQRSNLQIVFTVYEFASFYTYNMIWTYFLSFLIT